MERYQCFSCPASVKMVWGPTFCGACCDSGRHHKWWAQYEAFKQSGMNIQAASEKASALLRAEVTVINKKAVQ